MNRHTIILVQPTAGKASRTFADFETVPLAMDGVCQMFEKRLKELNPSMRSITYDINDLYHYIDLLPDLSALVLAPGASTLASVVAGRAGRAAEPHSRDARDQQMHRAHELLWRSLSCAQAP
jgi:hypothetical protein